MAGVGEGLPSVGQLAGIEPMKLGFPCLHLGAGNQCGKMSAFGLLKLSGKLDPGSCLFGLISLIGVVLLKQGVGLPAQNWQLSKRLTILARREMLEHTQ